MTRTIHEGNESVKKSQNENVLSSFMVLDIHEALKLPLADLTLPNARAVQVDQQVIETMNPS